MVAQLLCSENICQIKVLPTQERLESSVAQMGACNCLI